jgi:hypothetical protein
MKQAARRRATSGAHHIPQASSRQRVRHPRGCAPNPLTSHKSGEPAPGLPATARTRTGTHGTRHAPIRSSAPPTALPHPRRRAIRRWTTLHQRSGRRCGCRLGSPESTTRHPSRWEGAAARRTGLTACPDSRPACYRPTLEAIDMGHRWTRAGHTLPSTVYSNAAHTTLDGLGAFHALEVGHGRHGRGDCGRTHLVRS